MLAKKNGSGLIHRTKIQEIAYEPGIAEFESRADLLVQNPIFVAPCLSLSARVEGIFDAGRCSHGNVRRQQSVQRTHQIRKSEESRQPKRGHLPTRMHSSVGTPRPMYPNRF